MTRKKHRKPRLSRDAVNCHHILWQRKDWSSGYAKRLRDYPYCRVIIPKDTLHRAIHIGLGGIPVPHGAVTKNALYQLRHLEKHGAINLDDPLERRLIILIALFECSAQPTADALKGQLAIVRKFYSDPSS